MKKCILKISTLFYDNSIKISEMDTKHFNTAKTIIDCNTDMKDWFV